ncbi:MAG: hypothetical protein PHW10_04280 [Candidatus Peribacteraceae bacterium]|nr:hypothetical protein [Candidatus Peribacteraceae bacterium]
MIEPTGFSDPRHEGNRRTQRSLSRYEQDQFDRIRRDIEDGRIDAALGCATAIKMHLGYVANRIKSLFPDPKLLEADGTDPNITDHRPVHDPRARQDRAFDDHER